MTKPRAPRPFHCDRVGRVAQWRRPLLRRGDQPRAGRPTRAPLGGRHDHPCGAPAPPPLVATNKSLAKSNKSSTGRGATKKARAMRSEGLQRSSRRSLLIQLARPLSPASTGRAAISRGSPAWEWR
jgi:hypothetical protein